MSKKPILFDGPHGIPLWDKAEAHGYEKKAVWMYNIEHPELVEELEREYLAAGAKVMLANTCSANGPAVAKLSSYTTPQVVAAAFDILNRVIEGTDVLPGIAVGPVSELLEPYGDLEEDECEAIFDEMITAGIEHGAKFAYLQTFLDLNMMEVAARVCVKHNFPFMSSLTFETNHHTMFGNTPQDVVDTIGPMGPMAIGVNCSLGPDQYIPIIQEFASITDIPLVLKANSGKAVLHGGTGVGSDPESYAKTLEPIFDIVTYIGGCCGCDPDYIVELKKLLD